MATTTTGAELCKGIVSCYRHVVQSLHTLMKDVEAVKDFISCFDSMASSTVSPDALFVQCVIHILSYQCWIAHLQL